MTSNRSRLHQEIAINVLGSSSAARMVCSYSTGHEGRVTAHCTYRAPKHSEQSEHSTGISFLGIDGTPTLEVVQKFAASMNDTGQMSFDFVESGGDGAR